ncbi:acyl-CoA dehydrogenase [Pseudomonas sp. S31]|nr:acyl-CoA dehydrogenase [Pseudomonas sp. S31]
MLQISCFIFLNPHRNPTHLCDTQPYPFNHYNATLLRVSRYDIV